MEETPVCFWCKVDCGMIGLCHCGCDTPTRQEDSNSHDYFKDRTNFFVPKGTHRRYVGVHAHRRRRALTNDQVRDIIRRRKAGETYKSIADDLGVRNTLVEQVVYGKSYKEEPR